MTGGLEISCDCCHEQLKVPGALYFGPPELGVAVKKHICVECVPLVEALFSQSRQGSSEPMVTVAQLRAMLAQCPPDSPVVLHTGGGATHSLAKVFPDARGRPRGERSGLPPESLVLLSAYPPKG